jgi:putative peptide zinc metalloprotease protein
MFAPLTIISVLVGLLVVSLSVLLQVLAHPDQLVYDISKIQGDRWIALAALMMVIKSLHELGHYLACVYLKVRCSEVGVLLLCFTPCLYCDTTDGWKLPSRWQRAGIAAAGVYFELIIAIFGGLMFLYHEQGFLHILGGGMWLMCTAGTLILNANPLFRYDGYFVLSDLLRAPNLATQGTRSLWDGFISLLGGRSLNPQDYDLPLRWLLPFAAASLFYRLLIAIGILTFLWKFLLPLGLGLPFLFLSCVMAIGMLRAGVRNMHSVIAELFAREPISWKRLSALITLLVALGVLAVSWRLPSGSVHRGYVEISGSQPMYAATDGVLSQVHNWNTPLKEGDAILTLTNSELDWSILNAEQEHRLLVERVRVLEQAKSLDETLAAEIPTLAQMASESEAKWKMLEKERQRLSFVAPNSGRFVPKSNWIPAGFNLGEVVREFEPAMAQEHVGVGVERGQLLGWFESSTGAPQVIALVPMKTLRYLTPNQRVRLISEAKSNFSYPGRITHIGSEPIDVFPEELVDDSSFVLARDEQGKLRSDELLYRVRVNIDQEPNKNDAQEQGAGSFTRGSRCSIRFELPSKTLWQRGIEEFRKTFEPSGSNENR